MGAAHLGDGAVAARRRRPRGGPIRAADTAAPTPGGASMARRAPRLLRWLVKQQPAAKRLNLHVRWHLVSAGAAAASPNVTFA